MSGLRLLKNTPTVITFPILLLMLLSDYYLAFLEIIPFPLNFFGIIFIILGNFVLISARRIFSKFKVSVEPNEKTVILVDAGIYKFSRNPMYLAIILIILGLAILLADLTPFIFVLIYFLILNYYYIPNEERKLKKRFKNKWLEYSNKVGRWITIS